MDTLEVAIELPSCQPEIEYIWSIFAHHHNLRYSVNGQTPNLRIGPSGQHDIQVSQQFADMLETGNFDHHKVFESEPLICNTDGSPDFLGTAFYMINSLQEHESTELDQFARFPQGAGYQHRFSCMEADLVSELFDNLLDHINTHLGTNFPKRDTPSRVFLTQDVDRIGESWLREGKHAIKKGRVDQVIRQTGNLVTGKSDWLNMEAIIALHEKHGMKSTFFWLVQQGTDALGIKNADYDIETPLFRSVTKNIEDSGFHNGLHKSTFDTSFKEEFARVSNAGVWNRNHYLKFTLPDQYDQIESAGFRLDSSLGYSVGMGYRNSYGLPFQPYNLKKRRPYNFVEVPLNVMDTAVWKATDDTVSSVTNFLEQNERNKIITMLWHNNYLTPKKYRKELTDYDTLLAYLKDKGYESVGPEDLVNEFFINSNSAATANSAR